MDLCCLCLAWFWFGLGCVWVKPRTPPPWLVVVRGGVDLFWLWFCFGLTRLSLVVLGVRWLDRDTLLGSRVEVGFYYGVKFVFIKRGF